MAVFAAAPLNTGFGVARGFAVFSIASLGTGVDLGVTCYSTVLAITSLSTRFRVIAC